MDNKNEFHAYVLGALLHDNLCKREAKNDKRNDS
jgi:hypothetical protein